MGHVVDSAVVRIMRGHEPVGAGCLVHGRLILTCAHVVRDALDLPRTAKDRADAPTSIEFPKFPEIKGLHGRPIFWRPWASEIADDGLTDIAVLALDDIPADPTPAHLLKSDDERLGSVIAYGFPEDAPLGSRFGQWMPADSDLQVIGPAWFPLYRPAISRGFIRPGYSGGPVVVDDGGPHAGRVAGIVALRNLAKKAEQQAAYAISAEVLRQALDMAQQELVPHGPARSRVSSKSASDAAALGPELAGALTDLRSACADLLSRHNVPADLVRRVDRLARATQRSVRTDGQPDLERLADYNEDWADAAEAIERAELSSLFDNSPVRRLIDQIDQMSNQVALSRGPAEPDLRIPWDDLEDPATRAALALDAACDDAQDRLWPENAEPTQTERDAWHDVEAVRQTTICRDGYDSRRMDLNRRRLERHKVNLLQRTRALIGVLQGKFAERLRPGTVFRDADFGPEMVVVPAGSFTMRSPSGEPERGEHEGPQHEVTIAGPFALGRYPLTFDEFDHFCRETDREPPGDRENWGRRRRPVIKVSHEDADAYLAWLARTTGQGYRLPSEAEWEYACRAWTTTPFWTGETISTDQANYDGNHTYGSGKKGRYRRQTTPVGQFAANLFGLFDIHGNIWEWCADSWHGDYQGAPTDGSVWLDGGDVSSAVVRGGAWFFGPGYCRSAYRNWNHRDGRYIHVGFRAARTLG